MNIKNFEYKKELNFALALIKKAYKVCIYRKKKVVSVKSDKTLVTNEDVATEKYLISKISNRFGDNFLSEECNAESEMGDRTWVIDPIDGTFFFARNSEFYSMQVAFYDKKQTQFSIIYLPAINEIYVAVKGYGAYKNNQKLSRAQNVKFDQSVISINGSIAHWTQNAKEDFEKLYNFSKNNYSAPKLLEINSSGYVYALLANGTIDFLVQTAKNAWDCLPGDLLAKECGAKYKMVNNTRYYSFSQELSDFLDLKI